MSRVPTWRWRPIYKQPRPKGILVINRVLIGRYMGLWPAQGAQARFRPEYPAGTGRSVRSGRSLRVASGRYPIWCSGCKRVRSARGRRSLLSGPGGESGLGGVSGVHQADTPAQSAASSLSLVHLLVHPRCVHAGYAGARA